MKRSLWFGILWAGAFLCTVLAVACVVFAYEASRWNNRLAAMEGSPEKIRRIVSDKEFQAGYLQWRRLGAAKSGKEPDKNAIWKLISTTAKGFLNESKLNVRELAPKESQVQGKAEIRAEFELGVIDTRKLEQLIQSIERAHPELVCKEMQLKPSDKPYHYEVPRIVFSVYVPAK